MTPVEPLAYLGAVVRLRTLEAANGPPAASVLRSKPRALPGRLVTGSEH